MKTIALAMCLLMLSGCAALQERIAKLNVKKGSYNSFVAPEITASDSVIITKGMAKFLGGQMAYAKTTLELEPVQNPFHAQLRDQLRGMGFGVVETVIPNQDAVPIRYYVSPLETGVLVRMNYLGKSANLFFSRTPSGLSINTYAMRGSK